MLFKEIQWFFLPGILLYYFNCNFLLCGFKSFIINEGDRMGTGY